MENKILIAELLRCALQQTDSQKDLSNIRITNDGQHQELAVLEYNSSKNNVVVDINHDSGLMMIKDIINAVEL
ncbi:hypothetical protein [Pseudobutyrivibrio sp.]|uniref:hypothetical protein n=1 Tax=Pseudobutyrivibrio sp. TaxID=2014367 RepID=UPI001B5CFF03|nr:hypothetical protein [Pseudobutyrivibrio sp.]MBP3261048.1 hypothetical protein [Pseudobutyrivibrio sp.]